MKDLKVYLLILCVLALCYVCNDYRAQNRELVDAHHDYVRRTELDMADVKARLATLERVNIRLDVIDHTGLWMVQGGEVTK